MDDLTSAKVLADSVYVNAYENRLITIEVTYPRIIHSEVMTHRQFSRNTASSRAIPVEKQIQRVMQTPFVPQRWPRNQPGMSASEYWEPGSTQAQGAEYFWLSARNAAVNQVRSLIDMQGVHKQIANRLLEPFLFHTAIISATWPSWKAMFVLRDHPDAQPEFRTLAIAMKIAIGNSTSQILRSREWHLPLVGFEGDDDLSLADKIRVSVARTARVSYLTHEGQRDVDADLGLYKRLHESNHLSPFEHPAMPSHQPLHWANFRGWQQARSFIERESPLPGDFAE